MKKRILLIEDDIKLIKYMDEYLTAYDYSIQTVKDFDNMQEEISNADSDLILLDINLPRFDGFYFLKKITENSNTPVILTGIGR